MSNALDRMLERLTDVYTKEKDSNLAYTLQLAAEEIDELRETIQRTGDWREINEAEGETLDLIGYNVQQYRGQATDPVYRILIKSKIARNMSDGSINTIIRILAITLDTDRDRISVTPQWQEDGEPATVYIEVPTERLNEVGFSVNQFGRLCNRIVAGGVRADVLFEGTFEFSSQINEAETDSEAGFSDEDQEVGGYFGAIYDPLDDPDLPM